MLHSRAMVTDGGLETDLIYHHGLRCIASTLTTRTRRGDLNGGRRPDRLRPRS